MNRRTIALLCGLAVSMGAQAGAPDDPLLFKVMIDKLEWRQAEGNNPVVWEADAWVGKDLHKAWFKSEGEYRGGKTEAVYLEGLYSRAIAPYWDLQAGWRRDFRPRPNRDWFALGVKGLAPYWFEVDATLYGGGNQSAFARLEVEYEILFTQRLILTPELEANIFAREDERREIGSGLSAAELGLRLRYEIRREFAPYIGVNWERKFGDTGDFAKEEGEPRSDLQFVAGVRAWF